MMRVLPTTSFAFATQPGCRPLTPSQTALPRFGHSKFDDIGLWDGPKFYPVVVELAYEKALGYMKEKRYQLAIEVLDLALNCSDHLAAYTVPLFDVWNTKGVAHALCLRKLRSQPSNQNAYESIIHRETQLSKAADAFSQAISARIEANASTAVQTKTVRRGIDPDLARFRSNLTALQAEDSKFRASLDKTERALKQYSELVDDLVVLHENAATLNTPYGRYIKGHVAHNLAWLKESILGQIKRKEGDYEALYGLAAQLRDIPVKDIRQCLEEKGRYLYLYRPTQWIYTIDGQPDAAMKSCTT